MTMTPDDVQPPPMREPSTVALVLRLADIADAEGRAADAADPGGSVDRPSAATCAASWLREYASR